MREFRNVRIRDGWKERMDESGWSLYLSLNWMHGACRHREERETERKREREVQTESEKRERQTDRKGGR